MVITRVNKEADETDFPTIFTLNPDGRAWQDAGLDIRTQLEGGYK